MMLEEVRVAMRGRRVTAGDDVRVTGVSIDSRAACGGDLFVAIEGRRFDGHDFLPQAAKAGCVAAVVRQTADTPAKWHGLFAGGIVGVEEPRAALGCLAAHHRALVAAATVAVTGSNGKTTVKQMIHHILRRRLKGLCSPKSFNNEIGVPLTLLAMDGSENYVVCEIGSSAPGEITALGRIARANVAVITSVGPTHLEGLATVERVAIEKASLLGTMDASGLAVVWGDSELLDRAARGYGRRTVRYGTSDDVDLRLTGYRPRGFGQEFQLNGRLWVEMPVPGRHNAVNALAAIAVAQRFGLAQEEAAAALSDFALPPMRLERVQAGDVTVINDAYNANPASLLAATDMLVEAEGRRKVAVIGDMRELGDQSEALHVQAGRDIAARGVDLLVAVGPLAGRAAAAASEAGLHTATFADVPKAMAKVAGLLRPGDVVLIKGSRAMEMERLVPRVQKAFGAPKRAAKRSGRSPNKSAAKRTAKSAAKSAAKRTTKSAAKRTAGRATKRAAKPAAKRKKARKRK
jgi:UDP-N-acetylmuramoyl-tripeptide--D-alanyl-D-alanine ligase